jgi:hypothetical protein
MEKQRWLIILHGARGKQWMEGHGKGLLRNASLHRPKVSNRIAKWQPKVPIALDMIFTNMQLATSGAQQFKDRRILALLRKAVGGEPFPPQGSSLAFIDVYLPAVVMPFSRSRPLAKNASIYFRAGSGNSRFCGKSLGRDAARRV